VRLHKVNIHRLVHVGRLELLQSNLMNGKIGLLNKTILAMNCLTIRSEQFCCDSGYIPVVPTFGQAAYCVREPESFVAIGTAF
jgi:hypothetical protein